MKKPKEFLTIIILMGLFFISSCGKQKDNSTAEIIKIISVGSIIVDGKVDDWDSAGIIALEGLNWKDILFSKPVNAQSLRIKSVRTAHDTQNLFLLLEINPGVREHFDRIRTTSHIGYIFV